MALQPQVVTGQVTTAGLFRYSPQCCASGFIQTSAPLCFHLEKNQLVSKLQPIYNSNAQGKGILHPRVVLAQSSPASLTTLEKVGTAESAGRDNPLLESASVQVEPNKPLPFVEAVPVPQDLSSMSETSNGPLGGATLNSSMGNTSVFETSPSRPEATLQDIITPDAENSINAATGAASDSSQDVANTATDQFKSAKEAYEAMLSGTGNATDGDSSFDALSETSQSFANGISDAKSAILDGFTKVQESYQTSVDSVIMAIRSIYDDVNGSIISFFRDVTGSNEKVTNSLLPNVDKMGDSQEQYVKILISPFQMGTPVNNALKQIVTAVENITIRALVSAGELVGNGYSSVKEVLPVDVRLYLSGFEKKISEISGPAQTFLQQGYTIVLDAERAVGINPENPILPIVVVAGGSFSLGLLYWQLRYGGYSGDLAPAPALDFLKKEGNIVLIDIRSEDLRESEGILDLRGQTRFKAATVAQFKMQNSLQKMLKNSVDAEAAITASVIKNLKNVQANTKVILLDSDGSQSKSIARALKKAGIKMPYRIDGGFRAWKGNGLRVKPAGPETPLTILKEETEAILDEVKPTPLGIGAAMLGIFAGIYALIEWEKTFQFLGLVCICQVVYTRLNSYENVDDAKNDLKFLLRPFTLATQGIVWAAGLVEPSKLQLATSPSTSAVQDRVLQAAARHGPLPSEAEQAVPPTGDVPATGDVPPTGDDVELEAQDDESVVQE